MLKRYDIYFVTDAFKVLENNELPIHEVEKDSIVIDDCINLSFDIPVIADNVTLEDLKKRVNL